MAESAWLQIRQAREALRQGRLDDALRHLENPLQQGYRSAFRLARKLARAFAVRAQWDLQQGQRESAWNNLRTAELLHPTEPLLSELRQELTDRELRRVRALVGRRKPADALLLLERLRNWNVPGEIIEPLYDLILDWQEMLTYSDRGDFYKAWQVLKRLQVPEWLQELYQQMSEEIRHREEVFQRALSRMLQAVQQSEHHEVILAARELLAVAPEFKDAQRLQQQGWQALSLVSGDPNPTVYQQAPTLSYHRQSVPAVVSPLSIPAPATLDRSSHTASAIPSRLLLWVDQVGGYLLCLASPVTIGGHSHHRSPTIPLCVDLPPCFAEIGYDSEGFWLETSHAHLFINGRRADRKNLLHHNDRITLGKSCELLFLQPDPRLLTALLQFTSGHYPPLSLQAVILMGQQVVFGWRAEAHVRLPSPLGNRTSSEGISLCRCAQGLGVSVPPEDSFTICHEQNVQTCKEWGLVWPGCTVEWSAYRFSLESDSSLRLGADRYR